MENCRKCGVLGENRREVCLVELCELLTIDSSRKSIRLCEECLEDWIESLKKWIYSIDPPVDPEPPSNATVCTTTPVHAEVSVDQALKLLQNQIFVLSTRIEEERIYREAKLTRLSERIAGQDLQLNQVRKRLRILERRSNDQLIMPKEDPDPKESEVRYELPPEDRAEVIRWVGDIAILAEKYRGRLDISREDLPRASKAYVQLWVLCQELEELATLFPRNDLSKDISKLAKEHSPI